MTWLGHERVHLESVDSTSDEVWRRAERGASHGLVVRADQQTAGRGRQGRTWLGSDGNLMVSWLLRLDPVPDSVSALSIVEGLALARALDSFAPNRIKLKWPNDLLLDGRKVGGLLLESRGAAGLTVVSGLGLNLQAPAEGWGELEDRAIALEPAAGIDEVLEALLTRLAASIDRFLILGPGPELVEWGRWSALDGREVTWESGGVTTSGTVLGIAADGGLRVALADAVETVLYSGDVHLREAT